MLHLIFFSRAYHMTAFYCPYFIESLIKTNQQTFHLRVCSIRKRFKELLLSGKRNAKSFNRQLRGGKTTYSFRLTETLRKNRLLSCIVIQINIYWDLMNYY